jgi:hypothetical protein
LRLNMTNCFYRGKIQYDVPNVFGSPCQNKTYIAS